MTGIMPAFDMHPEGNGTIVCGMLALQTDYRPRSARYGRDHMKTLALAATAAALIATTATAGSYSEPQIEAPVIVQEATSSSGGAALPLFLAFLTVVAAVSN